jgi:hypothetical protein
MLSRAELTTRKNDSDVIGEPTGEYCDVILYFGIIDILEDDIGKKLEHAYKSFQYDSTSISAVDPKQYSIKHLFDLQIAACICPLFPLLLTPSLYCSCS